MPAAYLNRINSQLLGDLVEMDFQCVARLRRSMTALWTTRRLVGKRSQSLKLVARHVVSDGLKRASVEGAGNAVTSVCATVEERLKVHGGDRAVVLYTSLHPHQHRMPAAMTVKNFFTRQRDFHWPSSDHRQTANYDFVIE